MPQPISVCILAVNEAEHIARAMESARQWDWCGEILVFDSGSTDRTVEIARRYADRVEHHDWVDFGTNRRMIVEAAANDWVFILDADEQITDELGREIQALDDSAWRKHAVMSMPRRNYMFRTHILAYDPDRVQRLFDRRRINWQMDVVHDTIQPREGSVKALRGAMLHKAQSDSFADFFDGARYTRRTEALARQMYERGQRAGYLDLFLRPSLMFWKYYLLKGGFLQGGLGVNIAWKAAFSNHLKYARLWHLQQREKSKPDESDAE